MPDLTFPPVMPGIPSPAATAPPDAEAAPALDAARQFEALLLAQILRSVRESGRGFGNSDQSGDCATDFAEQQFARVLAQQGGLGLAPLIAAGLERKPANHAPNTAGSASEPPSPLPPSAALLPPSLPSAAPGPPRAAAPPGGTAR